MTRMASDVIEVQVSFINSGTARQGTLTILLQRTDVSISPELTLFVLFSFPYQELSSRLLVSNCGKNRHRFKKNKDILCLSLMKH